MCLLKLLLKPREIFCVLSKNTSMSSLLRFHFSQRFIFMLLVHKDLLSYPHEVEEEVVKIKACRKTVEQKR